MKKCQYVQYSVFNQILWSSCFLSCENYTPQKLPQQLCIKCRISISRLLRKHFNFSPTVNFTFDALVKICKTRFYSQHPAYNSNIYSKHFLLPLYYCS